MVREKGLEAREAALRLLPREQPARAAAEAPRRAPHLADRLLKLSTVAGMLLCALGLTVMAGWLWDVRWLLDLGLPMANMKFNTALSLGLLGAALAGRAPLPRRIFGGLVTLLTLLTALEYLLGHDFGVDELVVRDVYAHAGPPGRMAPVTTMAGLLLGGAVLTLSWRRAWPSEACALLAAALSYLALCGYLYEVRSLYTIGPYASMSLHTSLGLSLACLGVLCARPREGLMALVTSESASGALVRRLLPAVVLVPTWLGFLRLVGEDAGLLGARFGTALLVLSSVLSLATLTLFIAHSLHRAELGHKRALTELEARERELADSAARLAMLAESSRSFARSTLHVQELLDEVAQKLGTAVGELCVVRLLTGDGRLLEGASSTYHADSEVQKLARELLSNSPQHVGQGLSGKVAETGQTMLVPHIEPATLVAMAPESFRPALERLALCSVLSVPLKASGRLLGVVTLARSGSPYTSADQELVEDLADRAALALENATLLAELELRVEARTRALEDANRELESFSYSVSHDLRSPLRAIDGFSQALLADYEGVLDTQAQHYLSRIRAGTTRMSALIDDLLELSRIKRSEARKEAVDLAALAAPVIEELKRREPNRKVEFEVQPGLGASCDPRLVTIVLENLLGNAFKFTARRELAHVVLGREERDGETVFYVKDDGAGFDMQQAHRLFHPFHRLHHRSDFEGTGIGLATVQRIVALHGGRVWAHAQLEGGATFYFTLGEA